MTVLETLQVLATVLTIVASVVAVIGGLWGFYTGWLPRWLRRQIGFYELEDDIEGIRQNTQNLEVQHEETMAEIQTLKHGQVALAETVNEEHNGIAVERLREAHFGERESPGDFLRGSDSPYGDD